MGRKKGTNSSFLSILPYDLLLSLVISQAKIKVIKEVRGITSLGLKEAKELVEGAPVSLTFLLQDLVACLFLLLSRLLDLVCVREKERRSS